MANADDDISEEERLKILQRATAISMTIRKLGEELQDLLYAMRSRKKRVGKEVTDEGEPTFRFQVKCAIPKDIRMTKAMKQYALNKGYNATTVNPVWEEFTNYYRRKGTKWMDWTAVWQKWVRTEAQRRANTGGSRDLPEL
jgi:hypothetical protein